jgi:hypothetical protein
MTSVQRESHPNSLFYVISFYWLNFNTISFLGFCLVLGLGSWSSFNFFSCLMSEDSLKKSMTGQKSMDLWPSDQSHDMGLLTDQTGVWASKKKTSLSLSPKAGFDGACLPHLTS